jgi:large subunit ribosomal protein L5
LYRPVRNLLQEHYASSKHQKICLNRGVNGLTDKKLVDVAVEELSTIGSARRADDLKKDISNFKLRKAMPIGAR